MVPIHLFVTLDFNDTNCRHIDSCGYAAILNFKMAANYNYFHTSRLASTIEDYKLC